MIKIGITGGLFPPDLERNIFTKKELCYIEKDFANYWASFGVMPILIPNLDKGLLPRFLSQLDGISLMGGTDLAPKSYQENSIGPWKGDSIRDAYEFPILEWCINNNLPIFGICRGFQLLNVYFGGNLYQDIPSQFETEIQHSDSIAYDSNLHQIDLEPNNLFEKLNICKNSNLVNSLHHQAVKDLAPDLIPLAYSEDGLIEAFYHSRYPTGKIMGVQWHPEFFCHSQKELINDRAITEYFLSFCKED